MLKAFWDGRKRRKLAETQSVQGGWVAMLAGYVREADVPAMQKMLAAEFMQRQRSGKHPSISEYTARNPELAGEIEELFPAIAAMERLKAQRGSQSGRATLGGPRLERLGDFRILSEIGRAGMDERPLRCRCADLQIHIFRKPRSV